MLISFHNHTSYSFDCKTDIYQLIQRAKDSGINCLCITDHDVCEVRQNHIDYGRSNGVNLIKGIEFSCKDNIHIIGFHSKIEQLQKPRYYYDPHELIEELSSIDAVIYFPHPLHETGILNGNHSISRSILQKGHLIEAFNYKHASIFLGNLKQYKICKVVADDNHNIHEFPKCIVEMNFDTDRIYEELRNYYGKKIRYKLELKNCIKKVYLERVYRVYRYLKKYLPISGIKRFINGSYKNF